MKVSLGQGEMANLTLPLRSSMKRPFEVVFEDNHILVLIKPVNPSMLFDAAMRALGAELELPPETGENPDV